MGTSLALVSPSSSFNSLIKIADNSTSTTLAKQLSDGVGNNLSMYLGQSNAGIGVTLSISGIGSFAQGSGSIVVSNFAHAEGVGTYAGAPGTHTEGYSTTASSIGSHAEGWNTQTIGSYSHAEGYNTIASGAFAHAEGQNTRASGGTSHTEGYYTTASGDYSHAEGAYTLASGIGSHAEGTGSVASGMYAHAEGYYTTARGIGTRAEGSGSTATSNYSTAGGIQAESGHISEWARSNGSTGQYGMVSLSTVTTNATPVEIAINGSNYFDLGRNTAYHVDITLMASKLNTGASGASQVWRGNAVVVNDGFSTFIDGGSAVIMTQLTGSLSSLGTNIIADSPNSKLAIYVTGSLLTTIGWFAKIEYIKINNISTI